MKNNLFKETVTVTELKGSRGNEMLGELVGQDALRILHRDKAIKVVITEEFYLSLLSHWNAGINPQPAGSSVEEMKRIAREEFNSMLEQLRTEPTNNKVKARHG